MSKIINYVAIIVVYCILMSCSKAVLVKDDLTSKGYLAKNLQKSLIPTNQNSQYFKEKSFDLGLDQIESVANYAVDFDNDGYTDIVTLPDNFSDPVFLRYNPTIKQYIQINYLPFGKKIRASFMLFADFNRDNILDVIVANPSNKTELSKDIINLYSGQLKNGRLIYKLVSGAFPAKLKLSPTSIVALDFDLDGQLDLYISNWYDKNKEDGNFYPDVLLKGEGPKFQNYSAILTEEYRYSKIEGRYLNATPTYSASVCDINQDGYPDILTTSTSGYPNKLWINRSDNRTIRRFENFAETVGYDMDDLGRLKPKSGGDTLFSQCADYNNDSIFDIVVGELFHSYDSEDIDRSAILTGVDYKFPFKFIRSEYYLDDGTLSWSQRDVRGAWVDLNSDGLLDLLVENSGFPPKSRLISFIQNQDHSYQDQAKLFGIDLSNPSGTIYLDYDKDGNPDILTGQSKLRAPGQQRKLYFFQNALNPNNFRASIRLIGNNSNTAGIGALVKLYSKTNNQIRYHHSANGHFPSQNEALVFVGFGQEKLDKVEVTWPYFDKVSNKIIKTAYDISKNTEKHLMLTLCENGQIFYDIRSNCTVAK